MVLFVGVSVGEYAEPSGLAGDSGTAGLTGIAKVGPGLGLAALAPKLGGGGLEGEPTSAGHSVGALVT